MIYTIIVTDKFNELQKVISFSTVTDASKNISASVSNNPVESGSVISDNVVVDLPSFSINGILSSYDIFNDNKELVWNGTDFTTNETAAQKAVEDDIENLILTSTVFTLLVTEDNDNTANTDQVRYQNLLKSVSREYKNCIITNYDIQDNAGVKDAVFFKLQIKQLNIAFVRVDQLTEAEKQPALKATPKKSTATNAGNAKTESTTATDGSGIEKEDPSEIEKAKEDLEQQKSYQSSIDQSQKDLRSLENQKQAELKRRELITNGDPRAEVRKTPSGGFAVYGQ